MSTATGEVLAKLRDELDGEIDVSGPNIAWQFIERGLGMSTDVVHPVAIGAGTPFFPRLATPLNLRQVAVNASAPASSP